MTQSLGHCPHCARPMVIARLHCSACETEVSGKLPVPIVARLPEELAEFVLEFLLAGGSLTATQERLDCSYPKVRRLLDQTMETLRAELDADVRAKDDVLRALENGALKPAEAIRRIRSLAGREKKR